MYDRQPARGQFAPVAGSGRPYRQREPGRPPRVPLRIRKLPPGELCAVPGLRHRLSRRHVDFRVEPDDRRRGRGRRKRPVIVQVGAADLELRQLLRPAVQRHRREDPHLGRGPGDRDAGQGRRLAPLGAARPPYDLADPGVLPVRHRLRPLAVTQRALVRQHHEHRTCRRLQCVRTGRGIGLLDVDHQREDELRGLVACRRLRAERAVVAAHPPQSASRFPAGFPRIPGGSARFLGGGRSSG